MRSFTSSLFCLITASVILCGGVSASSNESVRGPIQPRIYDADPNATVSLIVHDIANIRMAQRLLAKADQIAAARP